MEIENLEQKLLVWEIGFQARQLIEKLKSLPEQDFFKLSDLEAGMIKAENDQKSYEKRWKEEIKKVVRIGEIYRIDSSDGVSGLSTKYYEITNLDGEREEIEFNLLERFVGEFDNHLSYKEKERLSGFSGEFKYGFCEGTVKSGSDVRAEFLRYQKILKDA